MKELFNRGEALLNNLGKKIQHDEKMLFQIVFICIAILILFETLRWLYQFFDMQYFLLFSFGVLCLYLVRVEYYRQEKSLQVIGTIKKHKDKIIHTAFILFFISLFFSYFIFGEAALQYTTYILVALYIVLKILGLKIQIPQKRLRIFSLSAVQVFLIGGSFLFIVLNPLIRTRSWGFGDMWIFVGITVVYLSGFLYFFTDVFQKGSVQKKSSVVELQSQTSGLKRRGYKRKKLLHFFGSHIYGFLSIFCIFGLLGYMFFGPSNTPQDSLYTQQEQIVENKLPEKQEVLVKEKEPEYIVSKKTIGEIYEFTTRLEPGSRGEEVSRLQGFLQTKGYFAGEIDGDFDEETRVALRNTLMAECDWPESTQGVLGTQAGACINGLEIEQKVLLSDLSDFDVAQVEDTPELIENTGTEIGDREMTLGDTGESVQRLQERLVSLGYLLSEPDGNFDLATQIALKSALIGQCGFDQDTTGNFDTAAQQCLASIGE